MQLPHNPDVDFAQSQYHKQQPTRLPARYAASHIDQKTSHSLHNQFGNFTQRCHHQQQPTRQPAWHAASRTDQKTSHFLRNRYGNFARKVPIILIMFSDPCGLLHAWLAAWFAVAGDGGSAQSSHIDCAVHTRFSEQCCLLHAWLAAR